MLLNALSPLAALPTRRGYSSFRIRCLSKIGGGAYPYAIAEIKFISGGALLPTVNLTSDTTPSPYVCSASSFLGASNPYLAFDGDPATNWNSNDASGTPTIDLSFGVGSSLSINGVKMTSLTSIGTNNMPTSFEVYGSQYPINWIKLASVSGLTWADGETKTITW